MRPILFAAPLTLLAAACSQGTTEQAPPPADAPAPTTLGGVDLSQPLRALGTEPFWSVEITKDAMVYTGVDRDEQRAGNPQPVVQGTTAVYTAATDDGTAMVEVSVFNELYDAQRSKIVTDEILVVEGKVSYDDFSGGNRVVADTLMTLGEARARYAKHLLLRMNGQADARRLKAVLAPFAAGSAPVRIRYRNKQAQCDLVLGNTSRVRLEDDLLRELREWLTPENVEIVYS